MSELKYWMWLSDLSGVRARTKRLLCDMFGGAREVYYALGREYEELEGITPAELEALGDKSLDRAEWIAGRCSNTGIGVVTLFDAAYPRRLYNIYDPPVALYTRGRLPVVDDEAAIAVVGTRSATPYGMKMAQRIGYGITKCGGLVLSGLTVGVDAAGAAGALRAGGAPIGVLGTAIDALQPPIGRDVEAVGALISEYPPGAETKNSNFRARNRITSGLSLGVCIVEAPERSGALLFADEAAEQGREIFAVPSNADAATGVGSNSLLRDGARPVTDGWEILCEFSERFPGKLHAPGEALAIPQEETAMPQRVKKPKKQPAEPETGEGFLILRDKTGKKEIDNGAALSYIDFQKLLESLPERQRAVVSAMAEGETQVDDIIARSGLPAAQVLSELTMLQLTGVVEQRPGKRFIISRDALNK